MHLVVAGNIGVGKTSLVEILQGRWGWDVVGEPYQNNPFLPHFYSDMRRWAFHSQLYFLGARLGQTQDLAGSSGSLIQDRCLYEDFVFARNLADEGHLSKEEFATYQMIYDSCVEQFPAPDLILYLKAEVPTMLDRIAKRGRDFEKTLTAEYLSDLARIYDEWARTFRRCPLIIFDVDKIDFVGNENHREELLQKIESAVATAEG